MKNTRLLLLTFLSIFIVFSSILHATGCDNSLDTRQNSRSPGVTIPSMNNISSDASTCISGTSGHREDKWGDYHLKNDYYNFTVNTSGSLSINTRSPDTSKFYLTVSINGRSFYRAHKRNHTITFPLESGDTVLLYFKEAGSDIDSYEATLSFVPGQTAIDTGAGDRPYTIRNPIGTRNISGSYSIIGNSNQCALDTNQKNTLSGSCVTATTNDRPSRFLDTDNDPQTVNSSWSKLETPPESTVVWAGLYWQGVVHNSDNCHSDFMGNKGRYDGSSITNEPKFKTGVQINFSKSSSKYGADKVKFKIPGGTYTEIKADQLDFNSLGYSGFKDVTSMIQAGNPNGNYNVADIKSHQGVEEDHGNYAAWSLVVIYRNSQETPQNITVFDGYTTVDKDFNQDLQINGFVARRATPIKTNISFFSMDGDNSRKTKLILINSNGASYDIENPNNSRTLFDSTIKDSIKRSHDSTSLRTDIKRIKLVNKVDPLSTTAILQPRTKGDRYTPSYFIFSTELAIPRVCYDYNVRKDDTTLLSEDRQIITTGNGEISINVSIRNLENSDFVLRDTTLKIKLTPSDKVNFSKALYSPNTVNTLIPAIRSTNHTATQPEIAIGEDATSAGGTIDSLQRYFTSYKYDMLESTFEGSFEIELNATLQYQTSTKVPTELSTANDTLIRCAQSNVYAPQWGQFNIERVDSGNFLTTNPNQRFPLYTQIAGRDFEFSMVSYDGNATPAFSQEKAISDMTVDVELIDTSAYDDNGSYFKCKNTDPSIIQTFDDGRKGFFVQFPSVASSRVDLSGASNINIRTEVALRNAAFRMWLLVDQNGTTLSHNCARNDDGCFRSLYAAHNWSSECSTNVNSACTTGSPSATVNSPCYEMLRTHCATPICSRDNFAIRPASYRLYISDSGESNTSTNPTNLLHTNSSQSVQKIAAGYAYKMDANATLFGTDRVARGYNTLFPTPSNGDVFSQFEFQNSTGSNCNDTTNADVGIRFEDGKISGTMSGNGISLDSNNLQSHLNVGNYNYHVEDNNWTIVDQQRYPFKTFPGTDDCLLNESAISSTGNTKSGCRTSSNLTGSNQYYDMSLRFEPYTFAVSDINMSVPKDGQNDIYMHDQLEDSNYRDMSVKFAGSVAALAKGDTSLSNFTSGCAAQAVNFHTDMNLTQNAQVVSRSHISTAENIPRKVYLKKNYIDGNGVQHNLDNNDNDSTNPAVIAASEFKDENNGTAELEVYYNFKRYENAPINPINIAFMAKEANSPAAASAANMEENYVPIGTQDIDENVNFYYGRIVASQPEYPVPSSEVSTTISFYPEIYCNFSHAECTDLFGFQTASIRNPDAWYINDRHTSPIDGIINRIWDHKNTLSINPDTNIVLTEGGSAGTSPTAINVTIPSVTTRTFTTTIEAKSDSPWFDNPRTNTTFLSGAGWAGPGKTGLVLESNASQDQHNKRTNW